MNCYNKKLVKTKFVASKSLILKNENKAKILGGIIDESN